MKDIYPIEVLKKERHALSGVYIQMDREGLNTADELRKISETDKAIQLLEAHAAWFYVVKNAGTKGE